MTTARIYYDTQQVDVQLGWHEGLQTIYREEQRRNESGSGLIETINLYSRSNITAEVMFGVAAHRQLVAWWSWARRGRTWALASVLTELGVTTLTASAAAGQPDLAVDDSSAFAVGDVCLLRAAPTTDDYEIVVVAGTGIGAITCETNLVYDYDAGATIRHQTYWPALVLLDYL